MKVSPITLAAGVLFGVVVWIVTTYGVSRLLDDIIPGHPSDPMQWWLPGAAVGVVAAIVIAGVRRTATVAVTAGLTFGFGLLAWQVVWAVVQGME